MYISYAACNNSHVTLSDMDSKEENDVDGNRGETTEPVDEAIIGLIM